MLAWSQTQLARRAGLGLSTVLDFERGNREVSVESIAKMRRAMEAAGIRFLGGEEPGVRLRG
jgi:transcriptional regulator with XRE-family HTH domain